MQERAWGCGGRGEWVSGFESALRRLSGGACGRGSVFVEYRANARRFQMTPLTVFESLMALRESGFWVEHERESIGESLDWIARLPRFRMRYSSIDDAVAAVRGLLGFERV